MPIDKIDKEVLNHVIRASRSSHPEVFAGVLKADGEKIIEVLTLPETFSSEHSVMMKLNKLPISSNTCGSVHSHPTSVARPSGSDISFFDRLGKIHIIILPPYTEKSWRVFNHKGQEINLNIVQSERRESVLREVDIDRLKE